MPQRLGEKVLAFGMLIVGCLGLAVGVASLSPGWPPISVGSIALAAVLVLGSVLALRRLFWTDRRKR